MDLLAPNEVEPNAFEVLPNTEVIEDCELDSELGAEVLAGVGVPKMDGVVEDSKTEGVAVDPNTEGAAVDPKTDGAEVCPNMDCFVPNAVESNADFPVSEANPGEEGIEMFAKPVGAVVVAGTLPKLKPVKLEVLDAPPNMFGSGFLSLSSLLGVSTLGVSTLGVSTLGVSTLGVSTLGVSTFAGSTFGGATFGDSTFDISAFGDSSLGDSTFGISILDEGSTLAGGVAVGDALPCVPAAAAGGGIEKVKAIGLNSAGLNSAFGSSTGGGGAAVIAGFVGAAKENWGPAETGGGAMTADLGGANVPVSNVVDGVKVVAGVKLVEKFRVAGVKGVNFPVKGAAVVEEIVVVEGVVVVGGFAVDVVKGVGVVEVVGAKGFAESAAGLNEEEIVLGANVVLGVKEVLGGNEVVPDEGPKPNPVLELKSKDVDPNGFAVVGGLVAVEAAGAVEGVTVVTGVVVKGLANGVVVAKTEVAGVAEKIEDELAAKFEEVPKMEAEGVAVVAGAGFSDAAGVGVKGAEGENREGEEVNEDEKVVGVEGVGPKEREGVEPKLKEDEEPEGLKENAEPEEVIGAPAGLCEGLGTTFAYTLLGGACLNCAGGAFARLEVCATSPYRFVSSSCSSS
jgi:hypothetical protein